LAVRQLKRHASWVQNVNYIAFYHRNVINKNLTNIGETLLEFSELSRRQYRGKSNSKLSDDPVTTDPDVKSGEIMGT